MSDFKDFKDSQLAITSSHNALVDGERSSKEIEAAVVLSKRFPRNEGDSYNRVMKACSRPAFASKAIYSFKRGGSKVEGPSIKLAEVVARSWGNLQYGVREVERKGNSSLVEAYCWDLETNIRSVKEFEVRHVRDTQKGVQHLINERDIYEMVANQGARRLRNCILSIIPEDVVDDAVNQVNVTLAAAAKGTATDIAAKIRNMVELFQELGVTREQLEIYLNTKCEAASSKQIVDLGKIYLSIKDNYSSAGEWFKMPDMAAELQKEAIKQSENDSLAELEQLLVQAKELGVPESAIDAMSKKIDTTKAKSVKQGIDFMKVMISDKMLERQADNA
jgi:hypothetical protein